MEWLELGVRVRLYSSAVKLGQEQETAGQVQVQPDAQVDRQIIVQATSAAGMGSSHGIKVFGVSLAGAQGRELHLQLCLPTEMFLDCIPAWTLMHPSVPHSLSSFQ